MKHRPATTMGAQEIRSFLGGCAKVTARYISAPAVLQKNAKYEADRSNIPLTLLNLDDVATLIVSHYENFDTEGRD